MILKIKQILEKTPIVHAKQQAQQLEQQRKRIEQMQKRLVKKDQNLAKLRQQINEQQRRSRERPPIFFVVGRPRSGTNWLMRTLNAHPEILCRGEGRFFDKKLRNVALKEMQTTGHTKKKIQPGSLYNALADTEYLRLWVERSVWTRDGDADEQIDDLTREAIYHFLSRALLKTNKRMVGDKTPLGRPETVAEISKLCSEAKVIHIIRDGRDQAISQLHHAWNRSTDEGGIHELTPEAVDKRDRYRKDPQAFLASGESIFTETQLEQAARNWATAVGAAYSDGPALLESKYSEVRYEDLLLKPKEEFGRLFEFLGTWADEETVGRCVTATGFEKRSGGRVRGQEDTRSGVRKGIAGDWKGVFNKRDRSIYKEIAGDLLIELGYEKDRDW